METIRHDYLRRLSKAFYQGLAFVHWSMTVNHRKEGWLSDDTRIELTNILLHTLARFCLACPLYCFMPDHMHLLWIGLDNTSDQLLAARFFRKHANTALQKHGCRFQKQAYDNVLTEKDREKNAVIRRIYYIAQNPARAKLVKEAAEWPFSGSLVPGYPELDWRAKDFAEKFWKIYEFETGRHVRVGNVAELVAIPSGTSEF